MADRSANGIAKWSTTTSEWSLLGNATQNGTDSSASFVTALAVSGTDLFVGGKFSSVSDATTANRMTNSIAKWSITTSEWSPLGSSTQCGTNGYVNTLAVSGTDLFVGGDFTTVSDATTANRSAINIAKWSTTTSQWSGLGNAIQEGTNSIIYTLAVSGTDLFVGGYFTSVSDANTANRSANFIAKWSTTTSRWSSLGSPTQNGTNNTTYALAVSGSDLFVGGDFGSVSDSSQGNKLLRYAAKWNKASSQWERVISDDEIRIGIDSGFVRAVLDAGPVIYVGGSFTRVGNVEARNVACLTKATGLWSPLGNLTQNGTNAEVSALALSGTDLFVGGGFTSVSDATTANRSANFIAKWSTTAGQWSPLGSTTTGHQGTSATVRALAVSGTDLFVGGLFRWVSDAATANRAAITSPNGARRLANGHPSAPRPRTGRTILSRP
jgi:trimeric autotransporter adhesin